MCLSKAYFVECGKETLLSESVCSMIQDNQSITLRDIIGREITVRGVLKEVDLMGNRMLIEAEKSGRT